MKYLEKHIYIGHILAWVALITLPYFFSPMADNFAEEALRLYFSSKLLSFVLLIALFYLNLNILMPNLLKKRNWVIFCVVMVFSFIALLRLEILFFQVFQPQESPFLLGRPMRSTMIGGNTGFPRGRLMGTVFSFILVAVVSSAMALWRDRQKEKEAKQAMEFEKIAAELAVLKLQISPHFLFNTLNNIRWLARQKSDKTEESIVQLSQLLRYMIYQANTDKVPLEQEVNHLKNYINLQKMRLTKPDCVTFTCEGTIQGRMIEPLLLIPFVENAFKYGVHSQYSSDIVFNIKVEGNSLIFESRNTIFPDNLPKADDDSGIGIDNVRKRLALHYPNRHQLRLNTEGGGFYVYLKIENDLHRH